MTMNAGLTPAEILREENRRNRERYGITAWFYDLLDTPWEMQYRKWRPRLVGDLHGEVLEAGVARGGISSTTPPMSH